MKRPNLSVYSQLMEEIKRRRDAFDNFRTGANSSLYAGTNTEFMALQLRMILELVALSSLSLHEEHFENNRKKFLKHWHPSEILADIERINPNFYPSPFKVDDSKKDGTTAEFNDIEQPYLTRELLIEAHGKCGSYLHAQNRHKRYRDVTLFDTELENYLILTVSLLSNHILRLPDDDNMYVVHMHLPPEGKVKTLVFEPT